MSSPVRVSTNFDFTSHPPPFANRFPDIPWVKLGFGKFQLRLGSLSAGMCGGMVLAARDAAATGQAHVQMATGDWLRYLRRQQIASIALGRDVPRYVWHMARRKPVPAAPVAASLANKLAVHRTPIPIALVTVHSYDLRALAQNHQVLAVDVEVDAHGWTFGIYDPNRVAEHGTAQRQELRITEAGSIEYTAEDAFATGQVRSVFITTG